MNLQEHSGLNYARLSVRPINLPDAMSQNPDRLPLNSRNPRQVNDDAFRLRMKEFPEALTMTFWENHFCTREACESSDLHGRIFDFGCGTGETAIDMARQGLEVFGYDISPAAINDASARLVQESAGVKARLTFVLGESGRLPFEDQSFDSIRCDNVFEYIAHPTPVLKELARLLKPGGKLLLQVANGLANYDHTRIRFFNMETLESLLGDFFEDVDVTVRSDLRQLKAICRNHQATRHPRIVCMMRIRNEERWIKEVFDSIARFADGIVVLDDGSTDHTPEICKFHPAVVDYQRLEDPVRDQMRDKMLALKLAIAQKPDWIMGLDGDEPLENSAAPRIFSAIRNCPPDVSVLKIESLFMWNDMQHYRTDGIYKRICQERLFRLEGQDVESLRYLPTTFRENGHCTRLPAGIRGREMEIDVKILHLGYMYPEVRARRHEYYRKRDPQEFARGDYDHLLDQPQQILAEWRERPWRKIGDKKQTAEPRTNEKSVAVKQEFKPDYYYANARKNLCDLVPQNARRVLDVGCGHGMTGGLLRSERGIEVIGVEIHEATADIARQHLSDVIIGDLENMDLPFEPGYFDCILLGDVLEHLINPWQALKRLTRYLHPQGTIVASIPNIRNLGIIRKLLEGSWTYEEWGILDKTHLRFFALKNMQELFATAGIEAKVAEVVRDPLFEKEMQSPPNTPADVNLGSLTLRGVKPEDQNELTAQQFIFTGTLIANNPPPLSPSHGERGRGIGVCNAATEVGQGMGVCESMNESIRTERSLHVDQPFIAQHSSFIAPQSVATVPQPDVSIIIPVFNNLNYTRQCITSLFTVKEKVNFEVIVVDNGSSDGTAEYLRQLPSPVRAITHTENLGFAKGCNAGAKAARGRYVVFLNNDTVAQPNWLSAMLDCAASDAAIGLVGNLQIYPDNGKVQQAGIVCGADRMLRSIYNNELSAEHPAVNKPREFQFVAGSCMLIEKTHFESVGGFDEAYLNSCEDVDLCMKVRATGRKVYYCPQSRILHYESRTVSGHDKNSRNYALFLERWGDKLRRDDQEYLRADGFLKDTPAPKRPKVVLIAPPRYFKDSHLSDYTGFSKNLGLGYIASTLRADNVDVSVIDAFAEGVDTFIPADLPNGRVFRCGLSYEDIASRIPADVNLIGINLPFSNIARIAFELSAHLKRQFPKANIVLGGVHPSAFPEESMREGVDYVIRGEGELSILALVRGDQPETIPGLVWRANGGTIQVAERSARIDSLDTLPFPAWDLLPMEMYLKASQRGDRSRRTLSMITSRGCPYACRFCSVHPVSGRNWRARSPENVLAEIQTAHERYGINHIEIEDDNFTLNRDRALAILRGLKSIAPDMTWSAHNGVRVDTLDEELLLAVKESGCVQLNIAIEHGSPDVLKAMNKRLSLDKVREVVAACGKFGIPTVGFCLVGYPGETAARFRESFLFYQEMKRLGLRTVAPFIVNAYPGTELYDTAREKGWLNSATEDQLFFLEDEFVSVTTEDFDADTVRLRKRVMEIMNEHPDVNADQLLSQIPVPHGGIVMNVSASQSPRVALLTTYNQHCGLSTYAEYLAAAMREHGERPLILAEKTDILRGPEPPDVVRCWTREPDGGEDLPQVIRRFGIQVVHVNHGGMFALKGWLPSILRTLRRMGIRIVVTFHSSESSSGVFGELSRLADKVLVHHPQNEVELIALGATPGRFEVVPHGMPPISTQDIFEAKLDLNFDPASKIVSTFGFVEPHKGILEVIEAMKHVPEQCGAQLHVLGGPHPANPQSADYLEACKRKALELGLARSVGFTDGYLPDEEVARHLRASDVIVMNYRSLRYESSGAAMIALATGRPVVSTASPTFEFAPALTYKATSSHNLAQAIYDVLTNPFIAATLRRNLLGYEKIASWDVIAGRVIAIYRAALAAPQQSDMDVMHFYHSHPDDIYAEPLQRERVRWLKSKAEGRILEIGPANGYVSGFVGGSAAVDINRGRLAVAQFLRPEVRFQYGDAVKGLPFADREFDTVLAPEILEHVEFEDAVAVLRECSRVGKRVLVTVPNADKPDYEPSLVHNIEHRWLVNREAVDRLLAEAGCTNYELDTSEEEDFYLLDIRSDATTPRIQVCARAAALRVQRPALSVPLKVGMDIGGLEEATQPLSEIAAYAVHTAAEMIAARPDWTFTVFANREPASPELRELIQRAGNQKHRQPITSEHLDAVYFCAPFGTEASATLQSLPASSTFVVCPFHDFLPIHFPDDALTGDERRKAEYLQAVAMMKARCDLFLCPSQSTAQDLQIHLQIPHERFRTIHGAAFGVAGIVASQNAVRAALQRLSLDGKRFLLTNGLVGPHRNAAGVLTALSAVRQVLNEDVRLAVSGDAGAALPAIIRAAALPESAIVLVSENDRQLIQANAQALLSPGLWEGSALHLLNAMAAGVPVIAGGNSAQSEICGDAAVMVNATDVEEIARAVISLMQSDTLRNELRVKGQEQAKRFTWRKTGEKTAIYLAESVARRRRKIPAAASQLEFA
jgi:radical SAM superfamily enzyme YgiQ (UPF0313 family)/GT2 family glycosyltransferase/glycosyltransferase involved in cell wall biosynthesis/SAM-dependent methyltransferase